MDEVNSATVTEWLSVGIAGAALIVAIAAAIFAGVSNGYVRGQRDAAVRQANAAEAQNTYLARQVELAEQDLAQRSAPAASVLQGTASTDRRVIPWVVSHARRDLYSLTNASDEELYDVVLKAPEGTVNRGPYRWEVFGPRAMHTFLLAFSLQSVDRTLEVTWRWEADGEVQTWRTESPPKH